MFSKKQMQEVFEDRAIFEDPLYADFKNIFWKLVEDCAKNPATVKKIGDDEYRISVLADIPQDFMKFFLANVTVPNELIKDSDWKYLNFRLDPAVRTFGRGDVIVDRNFMECAQAATHNFDHYLVTINLS